MGMSSYVQGFRPPDEKFEKMRDAYEACVAAGVEIPDPIEDFFEGAPPDPQGVDVDIARAVSERSEDGAVSHEVDLSKVPENVTVIRFTNSW